jgi:hypothetical protein
MRFIGWRLAHSLDPLSLLSGFRFLRLRRCPARSPLNVEISAKIPLRVLRFQSRESSRRQILWGARLAYEEEGVSMLMLLSDFVLFSFVVTLIAGLVLATASLLG